MINDENKLSLWWSLEPHCSSLALRLACPCQIVWLCVKKIVSIHRVFSFMYSFYSVSQKCVLSDLSLVLPGMTQTLWLMDSLLWGSLTSQPACLVTVHQGVLWQNIFVPLTPVCFTNAVIFNLASMGSASDSTFLDSFSVRQNCTFVIPQNGIAYLQVKKVKAFFTVASYTSLCLSNLRASIDFRWMRKNKERELNIQTSPHLHFFFLLSASLGVIRRQRVKVSTPTTSVFLCAWVLLGSF